MPVAARAGPERLRHSDRHWQRQRRQRHPQLGLPGGERCAGGGGCGVPGSAGVRSLAAAAGGAPACGARGRGQRRQQSQTGGGGGRALHLSHGIPAALGAQCPFQHHRLSAPTSHALPQRHALAHQVRRRALHSRQLAGSWQEWRAVPALARPRRTIAYWQLITGCGNLGSPAGRECQLFGQRMHRCLAHHGAPYYCSRIAPSGWEQWKD